MTRERARTVRGSWIVRLIGGVAVLATLIYLALQVQQSSRLSRAGAGFAIVTEFNRMHETTLSNPHVVEVLVKVEADEALSPVEERLFRSYAFRIMNTWNAIGMAFDQGGVSQYFLDRMKDDVVVTCETYPYLAQILERGLEKMPELRNLQIYEKLVNYERPS